MGIYVHIPFCRSKCHYCGFYSVASPRLKEDYLLALKQEIRQRREYLGAGVAETLYFGGGTPSVLSLEEVRGLVEVLESQYDISPSAERTIEVNPEDITGEQLAGWRSLGFNRLSVGVQSFSDDLLKSINRRHLSADALKGIRMAAEAGFETISADLIIGLPGQTEKQLMNDLEYVVDLPVNHLSLYLLSIEPGTVFEVWAGKGKLAVPDDESFVRQFKLLTSFLKKNGFDQYEISNFSKNGHYSRHNTAYWQQKSYVGFGAAAHSYDGVSRQWNIAHIKRYIEAVSGGTTYFEKEELSLSEQYNEYIMTGLRTRWGVDRAILQSRYERYFQQSGQLWEQYIRRGLLVHEGNTIRMTPDAWLISDNILSDLFIV